MGYLSQTHKLAFVHSFLFFFRVKMAQAQDSQAAPGYTPNGQAPPSEGVKLQEIATDAEFDNFTAELPPAALLVVYFHAPWAEPCKQMSTFLSALAGTFPATSPPSVAFTSLNAEELPDISEKYDVTAVPYIVLQRNGAIIEKISGSDASKVRAAVEKHAGKSGSAGKPTLPLQGYHQGRFCHPKNRPTMAKICHQHRLRWFCWFYVFDCCLLPRFRPNSTC